MPTEVLYDKKEKVYWFGISEMDMPNIVDFMQIYEKEDINVALRISLGFEILDEIRPIKLEKVDLDKSELEKREVSLDGNH